MLKNSISKLKDIFRSRQFAYQQIFRKGPYSDLVLQDLAKFCRAHEPTFGKDERMTNLLEGRREVWLRIQTYLELNTHELYRLHNIKTED